MVDNEPDRNKGRGSIESDKTAVVAVDVPGRGRTEVILQHYIVSDGRLLGYIGDRSEGADFEASMSNSLVMRSQRARETFDADACEDDDSDEARTDTHADDDEWIRGGDMMAALKEVSVGDSIWCNGPRVDGIGNVTLQRDVIDVGDREIRFRDSHIELTVFPPVLIDDSTGDTIAGVERAKVAGSLFLSDGEEDDREIMTDGGCRAMDTDQMNAARADAKHAIAAAVAALPYDVEASMEDGDSTPTYEAICAATGDREEIDDVGVEYGACPDECPVCGSRRPQCGLERAKGQTALDAFRGDGGGDA